MPPQGRHTHGFFSLESDCTEYRLPRGRAVPGPVLDPGTGGVTGVLLRGRWEFGLGGSRGGGLADPWF
jgi:hypothetical protein